LRNYVCALPQGTPINVNTAPLPVLMSLTPQPSPTLAQFVETRDNKPADSTQTFASQYSIGQAILVPIDVKSQYFQVRAEAVIGSSHVALYSVIYRPAQPNGVPVVISRSQDFE
jgi:general secretion pathway protein K